MIKLREKDSRQKDPQVSKVTEKEVINMIADFDLSDIKMLKILRRLKKLFGKKAFTAGIREALIERKKGLTKYFKEEETTFYDSSGEELKRRFVYTEELEMLLELFFKSVISKRGMLSGSMLNLILDRNECWLSSRLEMGLQTM